MYTTPLLQISLISLASYTKSTNLRARFTTMFRLNDCKARKPFLLKSSAKPRKLPRTIDYSKILFIDFCIVI